MKPQSPLAKMVVWTTYSKVMSAKLDPALWKAVMAWSSQHCDANKEKAMWEDRKKVLESSVA